MKKVYYYKDELNDDFAGAKIEAKPLVGFKYGKHNFLWNVCAFIAYRLIATPVAKLFNLLVYGEKIKNAKVLKGYKKDGFYLYGNHTMSMGDAFTPSMISFPKKAYILVGPQAVETPAMGTIVPMMGGVPVANTITGLKEFTAEVNRLSAEGKAVVIYPEAHIWPYYTGIRPFKDTSFRYAAENLKPVFCFTKTFHKRLIGSLPRIETYVDGPFLPDESLPVKQRAKKLRNEVYETMTERSKLSDYAFIEYVKVHSEVDFIPEKVSENALKRSSAFDERNVSAEPPVSADECETQCERTENNI